MSVLINHGPLGDAIKIIEHELKTHKPLTNTVRIEQMIAMLKNPTVDLLSFVMEKIEAAVESDLWWLSGEEQSLLVLRVSTMVKCGISNKAINADQTGAEQN